MNNLLVTFELFAAFASINLVTASIDYKRFATLVNLIQVINLNELFYKQGQKAPSSNFLSLVNNWY